MVVQSLNHIRLFTTPWTAACQAPLSSTISPSSLKFMSIELVVHLTISSFATAFFCLQSFPASGSFPVSGLFISGGQSIGASASVLPMNIQGWFPLGLAGLISLLCKGPSRVFSGTTIQKLQFFSTRLSLWSILPSVHDYWKNHSFNYRDLCQQSEVSAF